LKSSGRRSRYPFELYKKGPISTSHENTKKKKELSYTVGEKGGKRGLACAHEGPVPGKKQRTCQATQGQTRSQGKKRKKD